MLSLAPLFREVARLAAVFLAALPLAAVTYYVDPVNGSMANGHDGSAAKPWSTLQEVFAANKPIQPGSVIVLLRGYHGSPVIKGHFTSANRVTIRAETGHLVALRQITFENASGWAIERLNISPRLAPTATTQTTPLVFVRENSRDIHIRECYIYNLATVEGYTGNTISSRAGRGIRIYGADCLVERNHLSNTRYAVSVERHSESVAAATGNIVRHNWLTDTIEDGIRVAADNTLVEYNTILNFYDLQVPDPSRPGDVFHDDGIQTWADSDGTLTNCTFRGNLIIDATTPRPQPFTYGVQGMGFFNGYYQNAVIENNVVIVDMWHGISLFGAINSKVVNNTVAQNPVRHLNRRPWISFYNHKSYDGSNPAFSANSGNIMHNNIASNTMELNGIPAGNQNFRLIHDGSNPSYNAHFQNYAGHDLRLLATSNLINAGKFTGSPVQDRDQYARSAIRDIGAYEYRPLIVQGENPVAGSDALTPVPPVQGGSHGGYLSLASPDSWAEWDFYAATYESAVLAIRYNNGASSVYNRGCALVVNGVELGDVAFNSVGNGEVWSHALETVSLNPGRNTIRLRAGAGGGPNIDQMELRPGIYEHFGEMFGASKFTSVAGGAWAVVADSDPTRGRVYTLTGPASAPGTPLRNMSIHENYQVGSTNRWLASAWLKNIGGADREAALVFGYQDAKNYYYAMLSTTTPGAHGVYQVLNGVGGQIATFPPDLGNVPAVWHKVEVEREGKGIAVRINGQAVATLPDEFTFSGGRFGFGTRDDEAFFDGLMVEQTHGPERLADPDSTAPLATPFGDGVPNLLRFALGIPEGAGPDASVLPFAVLTEEGRLALRYRRRRGGSVNTGLDYTAVGVVYRVEVAQSLVDPNWAFGPGVVEAEGIPEPLSNDFERVTVRLAEPGPSTAFLRLRVLLEEP